MDNNLGGTRMNPFENTLGQNKQDMFPPLPTESPAKQFGPSPMTGAPVQGMQGMQGMPSSAGFPFPTTAGFPSAGMQTPMTFPSMGLPPAAQGTTTATPATGGYGSQSGVTPINPFNQPIPVTTENIMYLNAFLRTMIGRRVTVDFLIGTNTVQDRTGTLLAVGANYIVLNEVETDDLLTCDFFSIKFVRIYY